MSRRSVHRSKFRAKGLCSRLECTRLTGLGPTSLSFLPDDQEIKPQDQDYEIIIFRILISMNLDIYEEVKVKGQLIFKFFLI